MKCGLEIHQRLNTLEKLFCSCKNSFSEQQPKGTFHRRIRAVVGESGEVDPAAAFEASTGKEFEYQYFHETTCLLESDEEPPRKMNQEALAMVLSIAKALNARVVDEVYIMRKQVADGSATSGFQRTALIAVDGTIETSKGKVPIPTICLEEESSGIVEKTGEKTVYRIDRLGMPLIEIATDASIKDGAHAREVAEKIGLLLRSSGVAARGIGSIRQDLNVSIEGGARVEIKGAQELAEIQQLVDNEAKRQQELVKLQNSGIAQNEFTVQEVTQIFERVNAPFIKKSLQEGKVAIAVRVAKAKGILGKEILPNHRVGTEASDYAKRKVGVKGIIHCDEDSVKYGATVDEWTAISEFLECGEKDGWLACVEEKIKAEKALKAAFEQLSRYNKEVPKETRKAEGVVSKFMRPLPGSARMYPETDVQPIKITKEWLAKIKMPESFEEKIARYEKLGLGKDLAEKMARSAETVLFEKLAKKINPTITAVTLLETIKSITREGVPEPSDKIIEQTLELYAQNKITKAAIPEVLKKCAQTSKKPPETAVKELKIEKATGEKLSQLVRQALATTPDKNAAFNKIMREYRLIVDAAEVKKELQ